MADGAYSRWFRQETLTCVSLLTSHMGHCSHTRLSTHTLWEENVWGNMTLVKSQM